jgi:hypothetical protein
MDDVLRSNGAEPMTGLANYLFFQWQERRMIAVKRAETEQQKRMISLSRPAK